MKLKITETLLQEKLSEWTPSYKIKELLGLTSMDDKKFQSELQYFENKKIIIRDGQRKGLKFKFVGSAIQEEILPKQENNKKSTKKENNEKVDKISDIPCEVTIVPRHEMISEVTNVSFKELLKLVSKSGSTDEYSLSIKNTHKGITLKTYKGNYLLSEVIYSRDNFLKLLKASHISV